MQGRYWRINLLKEELFMKPRADTIEVKKLKAQIAKLKKAAEAVKKADILLAEANAVLVASFKRKGLNE